MIRVGPAGWSYPDWDGVVYPHEKGSTFHPLRYLTRFVDCLEINSTSHAAPQVESVEHWARVLQGAPRFTLIAKLHRDFTHGEQLDDHAAQAFMRALDPLRHAQRLSALLAQFPNSFLYEPHNVRRLGHLRALFHELPLVLEVRHASWFTPPALASISGLGYSLAHVDMPPSWNHPPEWHEPTGPIGYLRLHGRNKTSWFDAKASRDQKYDYLYSERELAEIAERAKRIARGHDETFVIANNHFAGKALANAVELLALLRGRSVPAPQELVNAYPRLAAHTKPAGQQELF